MTTEEKVARMSEIVRGRYMCFDITGRPGSIFYKKPEGFPTVPVLILPIEDGKVGGFEQEQMECLEAAIGFLGFTDNDLVRGLKSLRAALSRLFEEVEP